MKKTQIQLSDHFTYQKLLRFVLPSIVMMVFTSIYGVVDGLFVSNFAGKTPFAAINLVMPFIMVLGGIGFMIGTGGTALVSKTLGEGRQEEANRYFSMMILFTALLGVLLSVTGVVFIRPVALFLGATPEMLEDCVRYGRIVNAFTAAFMLQNVFQSFLIAAEKPKLGLAATVAAGVTNMALDALFVAGFRWGIAGAAVATGLSQCVGGLFPLVYFLRPNSSRLRLVRTRLELRPLLNACGNGSSELMSNISMSLVGMLYNAQLMRYGGQNGIAAYGVLMYVSMIFHACFIGYAVGVSPVVSFHFGAQNRPELHSLLRKSLRLIGGSSIAMLAAGEALARPLGQIFVGYDEALLAMTVRAFRIYSFSFLLAGVAILGSSFFTALNDGLTSALISFLRTLVFQIAAVLLLPLVLELGEVNLRCMALLDKANTESFGKPSPVHVPFSVEPGPFIIVSGHDLHDLKLLLEQTAGRGIAVYTHGEMLPAHAYPELKKYPHLKGNFGTAWQNQQKEFADLPAPILFTTNCLMPPRPSYADRVFTTAVVGYPDIPHIGAEKDFTPVIERALELGGYAETQHRTGLNGGTGTTTGFAHDAVLANAAQIVEAVRSGAIRHFFLVGGCDGARAGRNYYTEFVRQTPPDTVVLTLACGKYRFHDMDLGTVAGLPRLLDIGQCNDAYSAIQIALALAEAFQCGVNDLPLSMVLSWYEQKAVCILLTLLHLGIRNIRLGPTLPAFLSPNVLQYLVEHYAIAPITTPEADLAALLGS